MTDRTLGELVEFGGWPVLFMILVSPFGVYKIIELFFGWLYPIENDNGL